VTIKTRASLAATSGEWRGVLEEEVNDRVEGG
jgi:hypothetical protein